MNSEQPAAKHWADILGCDMRAGVGEIQRAGLRRAKEILDGPLRGEYLSAALLRISEAVDRATREKSGPRGRRSIGSESVE